MKTIFRLIAITVLKRLRKYLSTLKDYELKDYAHKINKKVDVPVMDEEAEYKAIYQVLCGAVDIVTILIDLIKV